MKLLKHGIRVEVSAITGTSETIWYPARINNRVPKAWGNPPAGYQRVKYSDDGATLCVPESAIRVVDNSA